MKKYNAKIVKRNVNKYCIHVPKKYIDDKVFKLGQDVKITIELI